MKSIRSFLLARLMLGAALVLAAAGIVLYLVATRALERQFDRNLSDRVESFASILFQVRNELSFEFSGELMPEYEREELPAYFDLRLASGGVVELSDSLHGQGLEVAGDIGREAHHWTAELPDGRLGRYVSRRIEVHHVYPEEGPDRPEAAVVDVVLARGREELIAAERLVLFNSLAFSLVVLALVAAIAWFAVGRGLEPLGRLGAALDRIDPERPPGRLHVGPLPDELAPVVGKTEALMGRVDEALERERRTTADIAHELRTPISELLTVSEVALRDGRDAGAAVRALRVCRDVARRMGGSVATLLKLARLEMGAERFDSLAVDLGGIVGEGLRALRALERERELDVQNRVPASAAVRGDEDVLRIVVSNLLCNALVYSPVAGTVTCAFESTERGWSLVLANRATALERKDLASLAEPFWRKDRARADREHSGLGLALSRALAAKAGLLLEFDLEGDVFRATLSGMTRSEDSDEAAPTETLQSTASR